jgi:NTP pyrophosphatase (non-canonical NTP hydrolase)
VNANEYQELAMRTAAGSRKHGDLNALVVMALGLCGESAELLDEDADRVKELGDCWWYAAVLAKLIDDSEFEGYILVSFNGHADTTDLFKSAGKIADYVKKVFGHGHELDKRKLKELLGAYIVNLQCVTGALNLSTIWEANIEKLKKRYPDGFSSERSINRKD